MNLKRKNDKDDKMSPLKERQTLVLNIEPK